MLFLNKARGKAIHISDAPVAYLKPVEALNNRPFIQFDTFIHHFEGENDYSTPRISFTILNLKRTVLAKNSLYLTLTNCLHIFILPNNKILLTQYSELSLFNSR